MKKKITFLITALVALSPVYAAEQDQQQDVKTSDPNNTYLPALPAPKNVREGVRDGLDSKLPLSNDEIKWIRRQMEQNQYATYNGPILKPVNRVIPVSIDPGSTPPVIHLMPSYVTAISIVDQNGVPWQMITSNVGSPNQFVVSNPAVRVGSGSSGGSDSKIETNGAPTNLLTVQPKFFGSTSNLLLTMKGLSIPVVIMLASGNPSGSDGVDGRVVLRLNRPGPDTPPPVMTPPPPSPVDVTLLQFLQETPPKDAKKVPVSSVDTTVWRWSGSLIVRTRDTMILPAWTALVKQDGWNVYQIPPSNLITLRPNGNGAPVNIVLGEVQ